MVNKQLLECEDVVDAFTNAAGLRLLFAAIDFRRILQTAKEGKH